MKFLVSLLWMMLFTFSLWSQSPDRSLRNGIKTNLLGTLVLVRSGNFHLFWWTTDLRYERKLLNLKYLSIVGEATFSKRPEVFTLYDENGNWMDFAVSHQADLNFLVGPRLTKGLVKRDGFGLGCYVELRAGLVGSNATFQDASGSIDYGVKNRLGATARLRGGIEFRLGRRIGLEISGDVGPYKYLGGDFFRLDAYPELSLGFWF